MFDYESPKAKEPTDFTGLKIGALVAPVFFLITFLYNADAGLVACIVLGVIILAIKVHWNLKKRIWFSVTIAVILALHIPLVFSVRWPTEHVPTLFFPANRDYGLLDHLRGCEARRNTFLEGFFLGMTE